MSQPTKRKTPTPIQPKPTTTATKATTKNTKKKPVKKAAVKDQFDSSDSDKDSDDEGLGVSIVEAVAPKYTEYVPRDVVMAAVLITTTTIK